MTSFWQHVFVGLIGSTAGRIVTLVSLAIGAKYFYSPEDIGYWGALLAVAMFLAPLATWRYELSIVLPSSDQVARKLNLGLMTLVVIATVLVTLLVIYWPKEHLASILSSYELVLIIPALVFFQNIRKGAEYWLVRIKEFRTVAFLDFSSALLMALTTLGAGYFFTSEIKIFSVASFVAILLASVLYVYCAGRLKLFSSVGYSELKNSFRSLSEYAVYPKYVTPYSLSLGLNQHAFTMALSYFYGAALTGAFVIAYRLVFAPVLLLVTPLRQVFFSHGKVINGSMSLETREQLTNILSFLVWTIPALAVAASVFVDYAILWFFGEKYSEAAKISSIVIYAAFANIVTGWMDRIYDLLGRQRLSVALQVVADVLIFGTVILLMVNNFTALQVITAFTVLMLMYEFIWLLITLRISELNPELIRKLALVLVIVSGGFYFVHKMLFSVLGNNFMSILVFVAVAASWCMLQLYFHFDKIRAASLKQ